MKQINRTEDFLEGKTQIQKSESRFALENNCLLATKIEGRLWIKKGVMVAYQGELIFRREGFFDWGVGLWLKRVTIGEGIKLTKVDGRGTLYLADGGKQITLIELENEDIVVNGNNVLMFEDTISYNITRMKKISTMVSGGIYKLKFSGSGYLAITTYQQPLALRVTESEPLTTDPNCTVAWSASLEPKIVVDTSLRTLFGRSSGETIRMLFRGEGFVVIQPYEEVYFIQKY